MLQDIVNHAKDSALRSPYLSRQRQVRFSAIVWQLFKYIPLCTLLFSVSYALKAAADDLLDVPIEDLLVIPITVASKTEEKLEDAPSSVTVFTRQQLKRMGVKTVEDLLHFVPGFIATRETVFGQGYSVSARGSTTPQASYNILFMMDGQRLNGDLGGGALDYNHLISLYNVKQVEVIRGPGSALYGTGAFSGVVNIITETDANEVFIGAGNLDSREIYFNTSKKGKDWHASASARYYEDAGQSYDSLVSSLTGSTQDPRQSKLANISLSYKDLTIKLQHSARQFDDFYVSSHLGESYESNRNVFAFQYDFINTSESHWSLEASYIDMDYTMSEQVYNMLYMQSLPDTVVTETNDNVLQVANAREHAWNIGINGRQRWNQVHESSFGVQWYTPVIDKYQLLSNYNLAELNTALQANPQAGNVTYYGTVQPTSVYNDNNGRDILGAYFQHKYKPTESLDLIIGARYDHYSDFGSTVNPRLAAIYSFSQATKFKAMYGEAFRAPSIRQLTYLQLGNPDLEAEKIKTLEFAWLQQHSGFQTALTYFNSRSQDKIDTILVDGKRKFMNLEDKLTTDGFELEATTDTFQGFSLRAAYTYLLNTEENPHRFPTQTFSAIANYEYKDWNFNLNGYFNDDVEQEIQAGQYVSLDAFWVANMNIRYRVNKNITAISTVENLFDEDYYSSSKLTDFNEGILNRGRTYLLGLEVSF
ncbi:outer membrane receptor for ferrienterochelin and colicins [Beggiatoa alba B18LD]|uniref:Outer membrane receptor for ferrienterochelin and colicins n=1 Tax=Beggiatoa alba B18LD TaxID=395493 RepID=I3CE97_9GAMM|nr:TonB-dependent receptor [Beggiatoa alba]EIJ41940.1 outer membrane receptor for ferrienterochelin and colicins [Beggiatoa alba B18LD]